MVTCAPFSAMEGTNVIAVAPLPITTTFLPLIIHDLPARTGDEQPSLEVFHITEAWLMRLLVIIVTAAHTDEAASQRFRFTP